MIVNSILSSTGSFNYIGKRAISNDEDDNSLSLGISRNSIESSTPLVTPVHTGNPNYDTIRSNNHNEETQFNGDSPVSDLFTASHSEHIINKYRKNEVITPLENKPSRSTTGLSHSSNISLNSYEQKKLFLNNSIDEFINQDSCESLNSSTVISERKHYTQNQEKFIHANQERQTFQLGAITNHFENSNLNHETRLQYDLDQSNLSKISENHQQLLDSNSWTASSTIVKFLELAGNTYDDNPKFWSHLRNILEGYQETLHDLTQTISKEREKCLYLEDELAKSTEREKDLEDQFERRCSPSYCHECQSKDELNVSKNPTETKLVQANETFATVENLFKAQLERCHVELANNNETIQNLKAQLTFTEEKLDELETEKMYFLKERRYWKDVAQTTQNEFETLSNEYDQFRKESMDVRRTIESDYLKNLAELKRHLAEYDNTVSNYERPNKPEYNVDEITLDTIYERFEGKTREIHEAYDKIARLNELLSKNKNMLHKTQNLLMEAEMEKEKLLEEIHILKRAYQNDVEIHHTTIEDYKKKLNEIEIELKNTQEEFHIKHRNSILKNELDSLRTDNHKLQKLLKECTDKATEEINYLKAQLMNSNGEKTRDLVKQMENREKHFNEQIDSMIELKANERVEAIKSKYENRIAKLKHYLMHKNQSARYSDIKRIVASELSKLNTNMNCLHCMKNIVHRSTYNQVYDSINLNKHKNDINNDQIDSIYDPSTTGAFNRSDDTQSSQIKKESIYTDQDSIYPVSQLLKEQTIGSATASYWPSQNKTFDISNEDNNLMVFDIRS